MSESEPKSLRKRREQVPRAASRIHHLCSLLPYTASDVQNAKTKGITPEKRIEILRKIEGIIKAASEQILALLEEENIPRTLSEGLGLWKQY